MFHPTVLRRGSKGCSCLLLHTHLHRSISLLCRLSCVCSCLANDEYGGYYKKDEKKQFDDFFHAVILYVEDNVESSSEGVAVIDAVARYVPGGAYVFRFLV